MHQHSSKYYAQRPPPSTLGERGQEVKNFFSKHGHVAYQIKGNDKCSNFQVRILPLYTPSTLWVGSKVKHFFLKVVMFLINLWEWSIEHHASTEYALTNTLDPGVWSKGQNIFLLKVVMLHINLKEMEKRAQRKDIFCPYTHP